jgi:Arm DNA-binding domain
MTLTDMQIKKANKGEKIIKLSDGGGLQLWIMPVGSKLWHLAYRDSQGKQKKLAFGAYPTVGLTTAFFPIQSSVGIRQSNFVRNSASKGSFNESFEPVVAKFGGKSAARH